MSLEWRVVVLLAILAALLLALTGCASYAPGVAASHENDVSELTPYVECDL